MLKLLRRKFNYKILVFACLLAVYLISCSSFDLIPSDSLIQRLKDRGPVLVSPDNPFLAANLLLKQESQSSKELAGFLDSKGQPSALSVTQDFLNPARMKLFYAKGNEEYNLELLRGIWIIDGPSAIKDQNVLTLISSQSASAPISTAQNSQDEMIPLFEEKAEREAIAAKKPVQPLSLDSLIEDYGNSPAETTPKGDIVHFVTSDQETLEIVSYWYTKSKLTTSRIAKINQLAPSAILRTGDQIVIPAELVKNKMRLSEEILAKLSGL